MKGCGVVVDARTFDGRVPHSKAIETLARALGGQLFLRVPGGEVTGPAATAGARQRTSGLPRAIDPAGATSTARPDLSEIIRFLNAEQIRATYGAVAEVLGVLPIAMGGRLGARHVEASWIVSAASGLPTGYSAAERHPALLSKREIIRSGSDLLERLVAWRAGGAP